MNDCRRFKLTDSLKVVLHWRRSSLAPEAMPTMTWHLYCREAEVAMGEVRPAPAKIDDGVIDALGDTRRALVDLEGNARRAQDNAAMLLGELLVAERTNEED